MRSKLSLFLLGAAALFLAGILVVCCLIYVNSIGTSSAEQSNSQALSTLAGKIKTITNHTNTLLTTGKTSSAISAKKTASLAKQIKTQNTNIQNLLTTYHADTVATDQHNAAVSAIRTHELSEIQALVDDEAAGVKETPILLKQLENDIAAQDSKAITTAVQAATVAIEKYFATHPITSVPAKG